MPIEVEAPDGAVVEFPDGTPPATIKGVMAKAYPTPAPRPELGWGEYGRRLGSTALDTALFNFGGELGLTDDAANKEFGEQYPIASTVAGVAGGVAPFVGGPGAMLARAAMGGRSLLGNVGRSAALGAGLGGVAGAGAGEGSLADRLPSAGAGAVAGGVLGAAIPPAIAGVGRLAQMVRPASGRPSPTFEPPIQPAGTTEPVVGRGPVGNLQFVDERTMPALNASEGGLQAISDWIVRAGGTADDVAGAWRALQEAQAAFHGTGRVINAQTLMELYPPLQRLMRQLSSGFTEAGEMASTTLAARQTGVLPRGADARDLAQRGIPTRGRFLPEQTSTMTKRELGTRFGVPAKNTVPTGALSRLVDMSKRMFNIKDHKHHGHASNASRTSDEILEAMRAESDPAYAAAYAAGKSVRPVIEPILQRWQAKAAMSATGIRRVLERGIGQFRQGDKQYVDKLEAFDSAKQALDDLVGDYLGKNSGRLLKDMRRELLKAVDDANPQYGTARGIYARGAKDREILEEWSTALKDDPDSVAARYDALPSDDAKKLAELGITWGLQRSNAGRAAGRDVTTPLDTQNAMAVLAAIGRRQRTGRGDAEDVMRAYGTLIEGEQEMVRGTAKTVTGGSMTDRNLQDAAMAGGMEIMQNIQNFKSVFSGSTSMWHAGQRLFEWVANRAFGPSAEQARETARMLLTANPKEIAAIIAKLQMIQPANRIARFNALMQDASRAAGPGASIGGGVVGGAPQPPQQPQGPTRL